MVTNSLFSSSDMFFVTVVLISSLEKIWRFASSSDIIKRYDHFQLKSRQKLISIYTFQNGCLWMPRISTTLQLRTHLLFPIHSRFMLCINYICHFFWIGKILFLVPNINCLKKELCFDHSRVLKTAYISISNNNLMKWRNYYMYDVKIKDKYVSYQL